MRRPSRLARSLSFLTLLAAPACALEEELVTDPEALGFPSKPPVKAVKLAISGGGNCLITPTGTVRCWGWNGVGQLGQGPGSGFNDHSTLAILVPGVSDIVDLDSTANNSCALRGSDGLVQCWGGNDYRELGPGSGQVARRFIAGIAGADSVAIANAHACATIDGGVWCWGNGYNIPGATPYQIYDAPLEASVAGVPLAGVGKLTMESMICALDAPDQNLCWGHTATSPALTLPTVMQPAGTRPLDVDSGNHHVCVVAEDASATRRVHCFGRSTKGETGRYLPANQYASIETPVPGTEGAVQVTVGAEHSCALFADGTAKCWGANAQGQLGNGTTAPWLPPVKVALTGITAIAAGGYNTCAIAGDYAYCWGSNAYGQVGDGTNTDRSTPVKVRAPSFVPAPPLPGASTTN